MASLASVNDAVDNHNSCHSIVLFMNTQELIHRNMGSFEVASTIIWVLLECQAGIPENLSTSYQVRALWFNELLSLVHAPWLWVQGQRKTPFLDQPS
jgi:hypothetical protein